MDIALQLASNVLIPGALYALITAGFSLIYAVTRVQHLAHAGVVILSGYLFYAAVAMLEWPTFLAAGFAIGSALVFGLVLHFCIYERLRTRVGVSTAGSLIATLSLLLIVQYAILAGFGADTKSLARLSGNIHALGPVLMSTHQLRIVGIAVLLLIGLAFFLSRTRIGTALRAVSEHATVAEVVGISAGRMRALAMGIGSFLAGVAGVLYAIEYSLEPAMSSMVAVRMFFRAVLGGIGSIGGATLGSVFTEIVVALTGWYWNAAWVDFVSFLALFAVLFVRPGGLIGSRRRSI